MRNFLIVWLAMSLYDLMVIVPIVVRAVTFSKLDSSIKDVTITLAVVLPPLPILIMMAAAIYNAAAIIIDIVWVVPVKLCDVYRSFINNWTEIC